MMIVINSGQTLPDRESMDFDVVIVGAGPAGAHRRRAQAGLPNALATRPKPTFYLPC